MGSHADPYRAARVRLALGTGVKTTVIVGLVVGVLALLAAGVLGGVNQKLMAGKYGLPAMASVVMWTEIVVVGLGAIGTFLGCRIAARPPGKQLVIGGQLAEVKRFQRPAESK